jgi:SAM-dependent methyltransferase
MRPGTLLRWYALRDVLKSEIKDSLFVLDIGGYDGYISYSLKSLLADLKIAVVDIDISGLQLAGAQGVNVLCASALELPIKNGQVDVVLCLSIIEHIEQDGKLIKEISRVLKKSGKLILTTPMEDGVYFPFLSKKRIEIINMGWGHTRRGYSLESIKRLFEDAGLEIKKTGKYFNFLSRFVYRFMFLSRIPIKGKSLLYRMTLRLEPYIKYSAEVHLIVAKKIIT